MASYCYLRNFHDLLADGKFFTSADSVNMSLDLCATCGGKLEKRHTRCRRSRNRRKSRARSLCETHKCERSSRRKKRRPIRFPIRIWNGTVGRKRFRSSHIQSNSGLQEVEEHSSDHPGEKDDKSDFTEQQDAMEPENDFWIFSGQLHLSTSCPRSEHTLDVLQEHTVDDRWNVEW